MRSSSARSSRRRGRAPRRAARGGAARRPAPGPPCAAARAARPRAGPRRGTRRARSRSRARSAAPPASGTSCTCASRRRPGPPPAVRTFLCAEDASGSGTTDRRAPLRASLTSRPGPHDRVPRRGGAAVLRGSDGRRAARLDRGGLGVDRARAAGAVHRGGTRREQGSVLPAEVARAERPAAPRSAGAASRASHG